MARQHLLNVKLFHFFEGPWLLGDEDIEPGQTVGLRERIHALQLEVEVLAVGNQRFDGIFPEIPLSSYENAPQLRAISWRYMEEPDSELSFLALAS